MKKIFLTFFALLSVCNLMAQKPFKPLSEFQQDTVAYLEYNYGSGNGEALKGKTIGEFLNGSDVKYTTFKFVYGNSFGTDRKIIGIELYLQSYEIIKAREYGIWIDGVSIIFPNDLTRENSPAIFDEFYSETLARYPLNAKNLNLIKNLVISSHYITRLIFNMS